MPSNWYTDAHGRTMMWQPTNQIREYMEYLGGSREDAMRAMGLDPSLDENDPDSGLGSWVEGSFANPNGLAPWKPILGMALAGAGGQGLVDYAIPYLGSLLGVGSGAGSGAGAAASTPTLASAGIPVGSSLPASALATGTTLGAAPAALPTLASAGIPVTTGLPAAAAPAATSAAAATPTLASAGIPVTSTLPASAPIAAAAGPTTFQRIMQIASLGREMQEARATGRAAEARNLYLQDQAALDRWYREQAIRTQRDQYADNARPDRLRAAALADYNGTFPTVTWDPKTGFSGGLSPSQLSGPRFTDTTRVYGDEARNRVSTGADRAYDPAPEPSEYPQASTLDTILGIMGLAGRGYDAFARRPSGGTDTNPLPGGYQTPPAPTARAPRPTSAAPLARDQYGLLDALPDLFAERAANAPNRGNQYNATFFDESFNPATRTVGRRRTP